MLTKITVKHTSSSEKLSNTHVQMLIVKHLFLRTTVKHACPEEEWTLSLVSISTRAGHHVFFAPVAENMLAVQHFKKTNKDCCAVTFSPALTLINSAVHAQHPDPQHWIPHKYYTDPLTHQSHLRTHILTVQLWFKIAISVTVFTKMSLEWVTVHTVVICIVPCASELQTYIHTMPNIQITWPKLHKCTHQKHDSQESLAQVIQSYPPEV